MAKGLIVTVHVTVAGMENYSGTHYKFQREKTLQQFTQHELDAFFDAVNATVKKEARGLTELQSALVQSRNAALEARDELAKLTHDEDKPEAEVI